MKCVNQHKPGSHHLSIVQETVDYPLEPELVSVIEGFHFSFNTCIGQFYIKIILKLVKVRWYTYLKLL